MSKEERNNQPSKPFALVTLYPHYVQIWTINAYECDELTASFDGGEIKKYKIRTELGNGGDIDTDYGREYFTISGRKVYLDECVRYGSAWLPAL
jgi:hypothetical protein